MKYVEIAATSDAISKLKAAGYKWVEKNVKVDTNAKKAVLKAALTTLKSKIREIAGVSKIEIKTSVDIDEYDLNKPIFYANITAKITDKKVAAKFSKLGISGIKSKEIKATDTQITATFILLDVNSADKSNVTRLVSKYNKIN